MSSISAESLFRVDGLVAVITGGGTGRLHNHGNREPQLLANMAAGIGLMMAKALAENGAERVYIIGRREQPLKDAADEYPQ